MRLRLSYLVFVLLLTALVDTKRSRARSGAIGLWNRKHKGTSGLKVRRHQVQQSPASKQPVIKDSNVGHSVQVHKPLASSLDPDLKKTRQSPKFRQKRFINYVYSSGPYPYNIGLHPGIDNSNEYSSNNIENYGSVSQHQSGSTKSLFNGARYNYGDYVYERVKKSGDFFGEVSVWYLVSGLESRPYKVYNFYNQSTEERTEIILPENVLMRCSENATNVCVPGTNAICTQDDKILCITAMTCPDNGEEMSVDCTNPCPDVNNLLCQNNSRGTCLTTMTLENGQSSSVPNITLPKSENNRFCVTTMAVPDPDLAVEEIESIKDSKNSVDDNDLTAMGYYNQNNETAVIKH